MPAVQVELRRVSQQEDQEFGTCRHTQIATVAGRSRTNGVGHAGQLNSDKCVFAVHCYHRAAGDGYLIGASDFKDLCESS